MEVKAVLIRCCDKHTVLLIMMTPDYFTIYLPICVLVLLCAFTSRFSTLLLIKNMLT